MQRPRLIAFCVLSMLMLMLSVAGSGYVFSQSVDDAFKKFTQAFDDEFLQTEEQRQKNVEYLQLTSPLWDENNLTLTFWAESNPNDENNPTIRVENNPTQQSKQSIGKLFQERMNALGTNPTTEEKFQVYMDYQEADFDHYYVLRQKCIEIENQVFPDAQKRQQRRFQLQEGFSRRLESLGDPYDLFSLIRQDKDFLNPSFAKPDFLELTPEQKDLIKEIKKETAMKLSRVRLKMELEQPAEKMNEVSQLVEKVNTAQTDEERNEIKQRIKKISIDMVKDIIPELKAILREDHENYMRVLTDAQKVKIKSVMDDMPDYMKNLFAAIDKQGGGLSILHNWQPGMGVPDYPNPNREAARERTNTGGGRAFPGE